MQEPDYRLFVFFCTKLGHPSDWVHDCRFKESCSLLKFSSPSCVGGQPTFGLSPIHGVWTTSSKYSLVRCLVANGVVQVIEQKGHLQKRSQPRKEVVEQEGHLPAGRAPSGNGVSEEMKTFETISHVWWRSMYKAIIVHYFMLRNC